jgi:Na+-transporting NADH:ubiquinone oxidoreductase subunit NqrB
LIALLAAKFFADKQERDREVMLRKWEQNELQTMWARHLTVLHMLRAEAEKKQKTSNVLIKGAYFGLKDNLKKMIAG